MKRYLAAAALQLSVLGVFAVLHAAPGDLDPTFGNGGRVQVPFAADSTFQAVAFQADNKVIAVGSARTRSPSNFLIARYLVDGSLDASFGAGGRVLLPYESEAATALAVAVQADGKILATGRTAASGSNSSDFEITRLNGDGSIDTSFGDAGRVATDFGGGFDEAHAIGLLSDGRILVVGTATSGGTRNFALARYLADGSLDSTFGMGGRVLTANTYSASDFAFESSSRITVAGYDLANGLVVARYNSSGSLDTTFDGDGIAPIAGVTADDEAALAIQTAQTDPTKIVIVARSKLVRLTSSNGALDSGFGSNGIVTTNAGNSGLIIQSIVGNATRILVAGSATNPNNGTTDFTLSRFLLSGALDSAFGTGGIIHTPIGQSADVSRAMKLRSNRIVVAGSAAGAVLYPIDQSALAVYNLSDGSLDTSFAGIGKRADIFGNLYGFANALVLQPDGKMVLAVTINGGGPSAVVRLHSDGTLDNTFGLNGQVLSNIFTYGIDLRSDGKIAVVGSLGSHFAVSRYNSDGTPDAVFGGGGTVVTPFPNFSEARAVKFQSDGKTIVGGYTDASGSLDFALVRYNLDGTLDSGFGNQGKVTTSISSGDDLPTALVIQPDGKIILAGQGGFATARMALARYNIDGSLDPGFSFGVVTTDFPNRASTVTGVALQPDGKIVAAGYAFANDIGTYALVRYLPGGVLDSSFDGDGRVTTQILESDFATGVAMQADGKIVAAGYSAVGEDTTFTAAGYKADGSLDSSYGSNGKVALDFTSGISGGLALALDSNGRAIIAGVVEDFVGVVRLQGGTAPAVVSTVSRKAHGAAGTFDISLPTTGTAGLECRTGGAGGTHQIVVTFAGAASVGGVSVTSNNGQAAATASASGAVVTVDLSSVANAQTILLTLSNVTVGSTNGNVTIPMRVLLGDTNGNGSVNGTDVSQTKSQSGITVATANFRSDVNASGTINASDVSQVKAASGTTVP